MDYYQRIAENFQQTIEAIAMSVDSLAPPIEQSAQMMTRALLEDRKIIVCGNGSDAALGQLFVSNLLDRVEQERPALPALSLGVDATSLTAIACSNDLQDIFARQIHALGQAGDILLCINSNSRGHDNLGEALRAATDRNMAVILLSNSRDKQLGPLLQPDSVELPVAAPRKPRVVELHSMIIQSLCDLIELNLFGAYEQD